MQRRGLFSEFYGMPTLGFLGLFLFLFFFLSKHAVCDINARILSLFPHKSECLRFAIHVRLRIMS